MLYDSGLSELEYNDDGGSGLFSRIDRVCGADALPAGIYYVRIDEFGNDDEIASYDITFTVAQTCLDVGPLRYDSHLIDDDTGGNSIGNGDGIVDCGETIELYVDLLNQGTDARPAFSRAERIMAAGEPIRVLRDQLLSSRHWHNMGYPYPVFVDWDGDGLPDLMLPNETNRIVWYKNVGTLEEPRFGFEPEVTAKIARLNVRVYEVGISYWGRTYEEGKKINWRDGVEALSCILRYGLLKQ